jgi:integrase
MFIMSLGNKPMGEVEASRLDDLLDGLECWKGIPEKIRGAPSAEQIQELVKDAFVQLGAEDALALIAAHGCGMRSNQLEAVEVEDFDATNEIVWLNRKGRTLTKVRKGAQVEHPVTTPEGLRVLKEVARRRKTGKMFPKANAKRLSSFVKQHAQRNKWNPDLWWSGIHNLRHGLAAEVFREGILRTRAAGSWQGSDAEQRYGRQGRIGPRDAHRYQPRK